MTPQDVNRDYNLMNVKVVTPEEIRHANVALRDGQIASVEEGPLPGRSAKEIDLGGKFLLPGIIDPHVHLRDMGESEKEDFTTATACAAVGGVTTVMQMPNGIPDVLTAEDFRERKSLIENRTYADIALYAWACDQNRKELHHFRELGAIGYKIFTAVTGAFKKDFEDYITVDIDKLFLLFEEIAGFDGQIGIHAESNPILDLFTERCKENMKPDIDAWRLSRPNFAEDLAVFDALTLSTATGARLHICHVIGAEAVQLIRNAKKKNPKITSEVAPCNLLLCDKDLHAVGSWGKFSPPVKTAADRDALREGFLDGTIDTMGTDHAPQINELKNDENIWIAPPGGPGLEIFLPSMLNEVNQGLLTLPTLVARLCEAPARIFRLFPRKGTIRAGADADLVVVDMERTVLVDPAKGKSKGKYTAFANRTFVGAPVMTFLRGELIAKDGDLVVPPGSGRFAQPSLD